MWALVGHSLLELEQQVPALRYIRPCRNRRGQIPNSIFPLEFHVLNRREFEQNPKGVNIR